MRKGGKEANAGCRRKRGQIDMGEDSRTARVNSETRKVALFEEAEKPSLVRSGMRQP